MNDDTATPPDTNDSGAARNTQNDGTLLEGFTPGVCKIKIFDEMIGEQFCADACYATGGKLI